MNILVNQTAFLGDLLLSIPLLKRLKVVFPNSRVSLIARKQAAEFVKELSLVDQIFEIGAKKSKSYNQIYKEIKDIEFDYIFSPHASFRSGYFVCKLKSKNKIGFKSFFNKFFFNQLVERDMFLPDALRQLKLLEKFDSELASTIANYRRQKEQSSKIDLSDFVNRQKVPAIAKMGQKKRIEAHSRYREILEKFSLKNNLIFIAPGSVWNTKRWTLDGYKNVTKELVKNNTVVLLGSPSEKNLCDEIEENIPTVKNLCGQTSLFEMSVLLTKGKFLICNDSGPMHVGSVAEIPTVSIFGPTVLEIGYQPWQDLAIVVENKNLKCRPCGLHGHNKCPIGTHECMTSIQPKRVLDALDDFKKNS